MSAASILCLLTKTRSTASWDLVVRPSDESDGTRALTQRCLLCAAVAAAARWESDNFIHCETGPTRQIGPVAFSIIANSSQGRTLIYSTASITIAERPRLDGVSPRSGPQRGGTRVKVWGGNLPSSASDRCYFGGAMATPRLRFQNMYECFSPPLPRGTFANSTVQVTINQDSSARSTVFNYFAEPVVLALMPPSGPVSGGTYVEITGLHFAMLPSVFCCFNSSTVVAATLVSSMLLQCITPHSSQGYTNVEVGLQRHDFSQSGAQFLFHDFVLTEVHPLSGPAEGNTTVVLTSTNFPTPCINCHMNKDAWCKFGRAPAVPAYHDALDHISCVTPRYPTPGVVGISIVQADAIYLHKVPYRYEMRPYIQHAFPLLGPTRGGTTVTLDVRYLPLSGVNSAVCRFGGFPVSIHVVSPTRIECVSPASPAGFGSLLLSTNDQNFFDDGLMFDTYHHPRFVSVAPLHGPTRGGTSATITGSLIYARPFRSQHARCQIDSALVIATFISEQEIVCSTPIHEVGTVRLQVTMNLQQLSDAGVFTYIDVGRIAVWPSRGAGGTLIHISDARLLLTGKEGINCWFGEEYVEASLDTANVVKCTTPLETTRRSITISVKKGTELIVSGILFSYEDVAEVKLATPMVGVDTGGTLVTLYGSGLVGAPSARCRFGEVAVPARLLSAGQLECTSPRPASPGYVALEVSTNGRDFSASGILFSVVGVPVVSSLDPPRGPALGGTLVFVHGHLFSARAWDLALLTCSFNTISVPAYWLSSLLILCTSPRCGDSMAVVEVANVPPSLSNQRMTFLYVTASSASLTPASGPPIGDTLLSIHGKFLIIQPAHAAGIAANQICYAHAKPTCSRPIRCRTLPTGTGFVPPYTSGVKCIFDDSKQTEAHVLSHILVVCRSPPMASPRDSTVQLQVDGALISTTMQFIFHADPRLLAVSPRLGPRTGGTVIHVTGLFLSELDPLFCRFGQTHTPSRRRSSTEVLCVAPYSTTSGSQPFAIRRGLFGAPLIAGSFEYLHATQIISLSPGSGPSVGGTRLTVTGEHFSRRAVDLMVLHIRFNATTVLLAEYRSTHTVICSTPSHTPGAVVVEATSNLQQFTTSGLIYLFTSKLLTSVIPASGPVLGGTLLSIATSAFPARGRWACRFGQHATAVASFAGGGVFRCVSPPSVTAAAVTMSMANADAFTLSSILFSYEVEPRLDRLHPAMGPQVMNPTQIRRTECRKTLKPLLGCVCPT